jgi:membrane protein YqaA with SNARE-associated domain
MLEKLFAWVEHYADHRNAKRALAIVAFTESSFFPIPPFVLIIAMLAHEKKASWVKLALIGMISSVCGGVVAYFVGKFFYGYIGEPLVALYGIQNEVNHLGSIFKDHVFVTILLASLSPLPYKVFTLSAGLFSVNLVSFIAASVVGRSIRFFTVAYVADRYGMKAKNIFLKQQKVFIKTFTTVFVMGGLYAWLRIQGIL